MQGELATDRATAKVEDAVKEGEIMGERAGPTPREWVTLGAPIADQRFQSKFPLHLVFARFPEWPRPGRAAMVHGGDASWGNIGELDQRKFAV